ncbi:hypothetical protein CVT25_005244 [Psilocybe cyanescens]|uniref:RNase H type-1 domain-containing protein n=1 Tax=Psilocybe cyanescens TaxID=93625 RepID=A0A409XRR3_PSICY|nr:hypothetical protein CVT25_005244 [Psilocybe cyanescens]
MHCLPTYKAKRSDGNHPRLEINGTLVKEVDNFKLLGIQVDSQLRWNCQLQKATETATKWVMNFIRLTKPTTGIEARLMRQLYIATVIPKMTYGLDIWYTLPTKPIGHTHNVGSVSGLRQLTQIQRKAALAIAGGLRSTPNELIDAHAGILPMELTLLKICHRATVRMATLPEQHPLHTTIRSTKQITPNTRYKTPIENLLRIFEIDPNRFEIIYPARTSPTYHAPFSIQIDPSREESMARESDDKSDIKVFSDGSGHSDSMGASAVLYRRGSSSPVNSLKIYLGAKTEHNTYEAEAAGGNLAMWLLRTTITSPSDRITVYIDNQSLLNALRFPKAKSGQCASAEKQAYNEELRSLWKERWDNSPRATRFKRVDPDFSFTKFRKTSFKLNRAQSSLLVQTKRFKAHEDGLLEQDLTDSEEPEAT